MRLTFTSFSFAVLLLGTALAPSHTRAQVASTDQSHPLAIPNRLVLKLYPEFRPSGGQPLPEMPRLQKALAQIGAARVVQKFPKAQVPDSKQTGWVDLSLVYEVEFTAAFTPEKAAALLIRSGCLAYAEPLYNHTLLYEPNDPLADSSSGPQYYLRKIRAYEAWNIERGDTSVVIAIVDTGTKYDHEDLQNKFKYNYADPVNGVDDDGNGLIDDYTGWDFSNDDNDLTTPTNNGHGVPVSGIAVAEADNGMGIAGVGFNSLLLPVKVYPSGATTGLFRGFEGVVYAADRGAKVINLSWGDPIPASAFQQDVINYATLNKNAVVVAAAGNTHDALDFYPSSYDNVLSVAGTDSMKVLSGSQTWSHKVDVSAPGVNIMTTVRNAQKYQPLGGSSFAAPQVAGAVALVRAKWPNLTAQQAAEQVRVTADPTIYTLPGNANFQEQLGKGFLDMYAALTDTLGPSVRNISKNIDDQRPIYSGDTVELTGVFKNFLRPVSGVTVTLSTASPFVTVTDNSSVLGAIATLASVDNSADSFTFQVDPNAPQNEVVRFRLEYAAPGYSDFQFFDVVLNPEYVTLNTTQLAVTLSSRGTIGYNGRNTNQGIGVNYQNTYSLLYEGGLMLAQSLNKVSDAVRSQPGETNQHFLVQEPMRFVPGVQAQQQATGIMADDATNFSRIGVEITQNGYANQVAPHLNYVITEYLVKNMRTDTIDNLHMGIFADWDINMYSRNATDYDAAHKMGYAYSLDPGQPMAGIVLLTNQDPIAYGINNFTLMMADSFSLAEKYSVLTSGTANAQAGGTNGTDIAQVVGGKIGTIAPNDTATIAFAIVAGHTLAELQAAATEAADNYPPFINAAPEQVANGGLNIFPVPASQKLNITLANPAEMGATLRLVNTSGQVVLTQGFSGAAAQFLVGHLPAGMYFLQLVSDKDVHTGKVVIGR